MSDKYENILKITSERLKYLNYSDRTIEIYIHYIEKFLVELNKYTQHLSAEDFHAYASSKRALCHVPHHLAFLWSSVSDTGSAIACAE